MGHGTRVCRGGCDEPLVKGVVTGSVSIKVSERTALGGWNAPTKWSGSMPLGYVSYTLPLGPTGESLDRMAHFEPYLMNEKLYVE